MKNCNQTSDQSVLQHGISVKNYTLDIINHLTYGSDLKYEWIIPKWVIENRELIISKLPTIKELKYYTVLHDCGKPYCLKVDELGKRHFGDHASISAKVFNSIFDNVEVEKLIKHDMDIHLLKSNMVNDFVKNKNAITHLIVGLAEIHSNAKMFGGITSTSFKIKYKCIDQRGKQIFKLIKNN